MQEAKQPTPWNKTRVLFSEDYDCYCCEKCGEMILMTDINYCPYCGLEILKPSGEETD